jgi:hypothetical protein
MSWEPERPAASGRRPVAGWYPDPSQTEWERYWDGTAWTTNVRDRVTKFAVGDSAYNPQPWDGVERRSKAKKGPLRLLVLTLVLVGLIAAAGHQGILPEWVPFRAALAGPPPATPSVAYPVIGSDELVKYLAASMIAQQDSIDVTYWANADGVGRDGVFDAVAEAAIQNPYLFVSGWSYVTSVTGVSIHPDYVYSTAEATQRREATALAVSVGLEKAGVKESQSAAVKAKKIHDYVASVATYDFDAAEAITAGQTDSARVDRSQEAYGILVDGTAVCNGYAEAFQAMAVEVGLPSVIVTGEAFSGVTTGPHAWNRVLNKGEWDVVDVTWDDVDTAHARKDYLLVKADDPKLETRTSDSEWITDSEVAKYGG